MGGAGRQQYLHPLTLEAQFFLNSLAAYGKTYNYIDANLCDSLKNIVVGIEKFLDQNPVHIVPTQQLKFVPPKELSAIQNIYHCIHCKKELGKSVDKAVVHLVQQHRAQTTKEKRKEKRQLEQKQREANVIKLPKKAKSLIICDLAKFFTDQLQVAEKLKQIPEYAEIEDQLLTLLKKVFPNKAIKLYKFGSRITGIGSRNSDLDIYVDIGGQFNTFEQITSPRTLRNFDCVHEMLKKNGIDWSQIRAVRGARVPIIRMCNTKTTIECDVGFSNGLGYCNTQLLQYIFQHQPIARRMCIFLKKWLERTRLNEYITTYCMSLMVIYFLQINNHLPSIETLQKNMLANVMIGPWIGNFLDIPLSDFNMNELDVSPPSCKQTIKQFCQFYANFNYDLFAVCPYFGRKNIEIKQIESLMPQRYTDFVKSTNENDNKDSGLQLNSSMVVQDPLQMNHNVAKRVSKTHLMEWISYLKQSADVFAELK